MAEMVFCLAAESISMTCRERDNHVSAAEWNRRQGRPSVPIHRLAITSESNLSPVLIQGSSSSSSSHPLCYSYKLLHSTSICHTPAQPSVLTPTPMMVLAALISLGLMIAIRVTVMKLALALWRRGSRRDCGAQWFVVLSPTAMTLFGYRVTARRWTTT